MEYKVGQEFVSDEGSYFKRHYKLVAKENVQEPTKTGKPKVNVILTFENLEILETDWSESLYKKLRTFGVRKEIFDKQIEKKQFKLKV